MRSISVNAFNEYFDFKSGLDAKKPDTFQRRKRHAACQARFGPSGFDIAWITLAIASLIGAYFLAVRGCLVAARLLECSSSYLHPWWTRNPFVLLAPGWALAAHVMGRILFSQGVLLDSVRSFAPAFFLVATCCF